MSTVTEALEIAAADLRDAVAAVRGNLAAAQAIKDSTANQATTIINNFLGRPPVVAVYCDPVNGNDANDGSSIALAKRSLDDILDNVGISATEIRLLNDATIRRRRTLYAPVSLAGIQASGGGLGFINVQRTITFLGSAENSPAPGIGKFPSGVWLNGGNWSSQFIDYRLPILPAGMDYNSHIYSGLGINAGLRLGTLLVDGASAGALIGGVGNTMNVYSNLVLGAGAAGHLFEGVAAGGNPNSFAYESNVTSA